MMIRIPSLVATCLAMAQMSYSQEIKEMKYEELAKACEAEISASHEFKNIKISDFKILAWYRDKDDRPIFIDEALCWAKVTTNSGPKWVIAQMWRNPRTLPSARSNTWVSNRGVHNSEPQIIFFDSPPSNAMVYRACNSFHFVPNSGYTRYDSKLDHSAWIAAIGEEPAKPL